HRRERVFILAYSERGQLRDEPRWRSWENGAGAPESRDDGTPVADAAGDGRREGDRDEPGATGGAIAPGQPERRSVRGVSGADERIAWPPGPADTDGWREWIGPQPAIRRGADGLANRVDRLRLC